MSGTGMPSTASSAAQVYPLLDACRPGQAGEELADVARLDRAPFEGAEHDGRPSQAATASLAEPALDEREALGVHAGGAVAVTSG